MMQSPTSTPSRQRQRQVNLKPKTLPSRAEVNRFAQKLNNSAAFCIEIGQYDRAIVSLGRALRLSELYKDDDMDGSCLCHDCSIEGCIAYSEKIPTTVNLLAARSNTECSHRTKKQRTSQYEQQPSQIFEKSHFWKPEEDDETTRHDETTTPSSSSFYRRPIQITPRSIMEGHNMGSTLFLIIVFNLGLAHHSALAASTGSYSEDKRMAKLKTTLKIYDLADSWYHRLTKFRCDVAQQQSLRDSTIRFHTIVCYNSCHIHQSLNDHTKHQESLEKLTSVLMLVVDHKKYAVQQLQHDDDHYCDDDNDSSARDNHHLEEFLHTASQLILRKQCADAA